MSGVFIGIQVVLVLIVLLLPRRRCEDGPLMLELSTGPSRTDDLGSDSGTT